MKKVGISVIVGAVLGYAYYYFIGCNTGTCMITSNPYVSIIYGAMIGGILSFPSKKEKPNDNKTN